MKQIILEMFLGGRHLCFCASSLAHVGRASRRVAGHQPLQEGVPTALPANELFLPTLFYVPVLGTM